MRTSPSRRFRSRVRSRGPFAGGFTAWIAIACLILQLSAATACVIGAAPDAVSASADRGAFPICHAHGGDEDPGPAPDGSPAPPQQHSCPFCAAHCHAAAAPASLHAIVSPRLVVVAIADPPSIVAHLSARFAVGAPPRGPPSRA